MKGEQGEEVKEFDRIVLGDGLVSKATSPEFEGMKKFRGKIIHSQAYKRYVFLHGHWVFLISCRPSDFKDMRVLVVGVGNSAADISTELIGHAKKIYLSHRGGAKLVSNYMSFRTETNLMVRRFREYVSESR